MWWFLFPQSTSLDSFSLRSDEVEGGVFCSSWFASEASFFDDQGFYTISDLLLPFKYWDSVLSFFAQELVAIMTSRQIHLRTRNCYALSLYFPLPFSPFIIISLLSYSFWESIIFLSFSPPILTLHKEQ